MLSHDIALLVASEALRQDHRVLEVLELVCARAWRGTSPTEARHYIGMMEKCPTLLLDEVEALRGKNVSEMQQAILAVLNAGHRKGATVPRCDGPKNEVRHFSVFGPKAFAAIGGLRQTHSPTVAFVISRCSEGPRPSRLTGFFTDGQRPMPNRCVTR